MPLKIRPALAGTHQRSVILGVPRVAPPSSVVAKILATVEPPVVIHALFWPCVVMQVPLDENEASPGSAGGILFAIEYHVVPSLVRMSGNTPFTESLCVMPRSGVQNAKQS